MAFEEENENLINHIKNTGYLKSEGIEEAMRKVPRHMFVPAAMRHLAYVDSPLSIGHNQTISQPATVVAMTEALDVKMGQKILEIGTGSGWQSALLSYLVGEMGFVYSIEIVQELVDFARKNLKKFGVKNVKVLLRDGSLGLKEEAPYDRIIVTAASPDVPRPLIEQLKVGGIIVIPVGNLYLQDMMIIKKTKNGIEEKSIGDFIFVPLRGRFGFPD